MCEEITSIYRDEDRSCSHPILARLMRVRENSNLLVWSMRLHHALSNFTVQSLKQKEIISEAYDNYIYIYICPYYYINMIGILGQLFIWMLIITEQGIRFLKSRSRWFNWFDWLIAKFLSSSLSSILGEFLPFLGWMMIPKASLIFLKDENILLKCHRVNGWLT